MTYLYANYDTYVSREPNPDGWDNGDFDGTFNGICIGNNMYFDAVETDLAGIVYVAYVTYYTGSTFGQDYRAKALAAFATEDEVIDFVELARKNDGYSFEYNGESYHRDWVGYFENLLDLSYERVII